MGFNLGGFELGLFSAGNPADGPRTYWGVADCAAALAHLLDNGATLDEAVHDVGEGIRMASVRDPQGFAFGVIEHPGFEQRPVMSPGPGR